MSMQVSASGLSAQRTRLNVASSNLANVETTRTAGGGPYKRRDVVLESQPTFAEISGGRAGGETPGVHGLKVASIVQDNAPPRLGPPPPQRSGRPGISGSPVAR